MAWEIGRLIDHVHLRARDLEASKRFYSAVLAALDLDVGTSGEDHAGVPFYQADELFISPADPGETTPPTHVHLAFQARDEAMVKAAYEAGLKAGGRDNGGPGERPYHPGYYAAFMLDPDGNNIEAVFHGPSKRSAPSIVIDMA
jgi:catechol 2,3-dioxygenase-like lactoylglutathione lyase family enzyme